MIRGLSPSRAAGFGSSGWLATARSAMGWIAVQMLATAFLRSANLLTCRLPEMLFQISTNRLNGQSADTLESIAWDSKWIAVASLAGAASSALANTVMLRATRHLGQCRLPVAGPAEYHGVAQLATLPAPRHRLRLVPPAETSRMDKELSERESREVTTQPLIVEEEFAAAIGFPTERLGF